MCSWGPPLFHLHHSSLPCDRLSPTLAPAGPHKVHGGVGSTEGVQTLSLPMGSGVCWGPAGCRSQGSVSACAGASTLV